MLIDIQLNTFAILCGCAALFIAPLAADAQLRRAGAPGIPAAGEPGYGDADDLDLAQLAIQLEHLVFLQLSRV